MDKKEFKSYCHDYLTHKGFIKYKSSYYKWNENGIVCCLWLQSSCGGVAYYINCDIFIDFFDDLVYYIRVAFGIVLSVSSQEKEYWL